MSTTTTNSPANGIARGLLAAGGGGLTVGAQNDLVQIFGALVTLLSIVWSVMEKRRAVRAEASDAGPGPGGVNALLACGCAAALCGCATGGGGGTSPWVDTALDVGVPVAACLILEQQPEAAPYLELAAAVFSNFAAETPPTPGALQAELTALPGSGLTPALRRACWAGAVLAYDALYRELVTTEAGQAALRAALLRVADGLDSALAACGPPEAPRNAALSEARLKLITEAVAREFRAPGKGRKS